MSAPPPQRATCRVRHNVPALRIRRTTSPQSLAKIDWILYRKTNNPYPQNSKRATRYNDAFAHARLTWPALAFEPLPHTLRRA